MMNRIFAYEYECEAVFCYEESLYNAYPQIKISESVGVKMTA